MYSELLQYPKKYSLILEMNITGFNEFVSLNGLTVFAVGDDFI